MKSLTTQQFWNAYNKLPENIQQRARKKYSLFEKDHTYPSLRFKKVQRNPDVYSVRITQDYRALGVKENNKIIWFWIGSHTDYQHFLNRM